jgi:hypothetical protein
MVFNTMGPVRSITIALVCGGFLYMLSVLSANAQPAIQITAPASGTVVAPGGTVTVAVSLGSGVAVSQVMILGENPIGFSEALTAAPFQFPIVVPTSINAGLYSLTADATGAQEQDLQSAPITIDVEPSAGISSLKIQPRLIQLAFGDSTSLTVVGTLATGVQMDLTNSTLISYTSSNPGVATVGQGGTVTAIGPGFAYITVSGPGEQPLAIPVFAVPASQSISFGPIAAQLVGATITLSATATSGLPVTFQTLTPTVCSVSQAMATVLSLGTCTIEATQSGNVDYNVASAVEVSFPVMGFTLTAEPASETINRGVLGVFLLKVKSVDGFSGNVSISCAGGPPESACREFPQRVEVKVNGTALALSGILFRPQDAAGTYTITFTGTSGTDTSSATAQFTVK